MSGWSAFCDEVTSQAHRGEPFTRVEVGAERAALIREYVTRFGGVGGPWTVLEEMNSDGHAVSWDEVRSLVEPR